MSYFSAPQTEASYPYDSSLARSGVDTNLAGSASPQQAGLTEAYRDATGVYTIAYASTITPNRANGKNMAVTLTGAVTIAAPTNAYAGQQLVLKIVQNTAGNNAATWNSAYKFVGGSKTLSTTGGRIDVATGFYDGTNWLMQLNKAYA